MTDIVKRKERAMPEAMKKRTMELMTRQHFHCSQAVLAAGQEKLGKGNEDLIRAMGAFGGGLAANGDVCGAVAGALAALGLKYGRGTAEEREDPRIWAEGRRFQHRFREECGKGSIYCRDIAGVDWTDPEATKAFYKSDRLRDCIRMCGDAARLLGEFLEK
jgi:C_GCAxxG_C_C family probable redox protein